MPCRSDYMEPTWTEREDTNRVNKDFKTMADDLTFANDVLREHLLGETTVNVLKFVNHAYAEAYKVLVTKASKLYAGYDHGLAKHVEELVNEYTWLNGLVVDGKPLSKAVLGKVMVHQEAHREADLRRLMKTFADSGDRVRLKKVLGADPNLPLEPQLGFSPDEF